MQGKKPPSWPAYPKDKLHTITADNGKEFAHHKEIAKRPDAEFYFARPYHSWECGAKENTNELIRQHILKGTDFSELTDELIAEIEWKLKYRPRKSLGYRTPIERNQKELEKELDTSLNGLVSDLRKDLKINGQKDVHFLCLWLLDTKPIVVAEILGMNENAVYIKRSRLKKSIANLGDKYSFLLS